MQRFDSEHDNESQTLLRSARNNFYTTIPLIWDRTSRNRLVLVRSEVLGQLVNTLTADYKSIMKKKIILLRIGIIYRNKFKRRYLNNAKLFLDFLLPFWNVH